MQEVDVEVVRELSHIFRVHTVDFGRRDHQQDDGERHCDASSQSCQGLVLDSGADTAIGQGRRTNARTESLLV